MEAARISILDNQTAWRLLPEAERGGNGLLPLWARALAAALPGTTAAMLELDWRHRAESPLDPLLRGKLRYAAAAAAGSPHGEVAALGDLCRAGIDLGTLAALQGDPERLPQADRVVLTFARRMTQAGSSVTDDEMVELIGRYGAHDVVAMVLLLAYAAFQDRLITALGLPLDENELFPPLDVRFRKPSQGGVPLSQTANGAESSTTSPNGHATSPNGHSNIRSRIHEISDHQTSWRSRIPTPLWNDVRTAAAAHGPPEKPLRIIWSLVCVGYQPQLAQAWSACTRTFADEARQHRLFEETLYWIHTRALDCFY